MPVTTRSATALVKREAGARAMDDSSSSSSSSSNNEEDEEGEDEEEEEEEEEEEVEEEGEGESDTWSIISRTLVRVRRRPFSILAWSLFMALFIALFIATIHRTAYVLSVNPYASDQIIANHTARIFATHASLPLLYAHILPAAAWPPMFLAKEAAVGRTKDAIEAGKTPCPSQLIPPLDLLAKSLSQLYYQTSRLSWKPFGLEYGIAVNSVDGEISQLRNRSHLWERLSSVEDLLFEQALTSLPHSINTHGMREIAAFCQTIDREIQWGMQGLVDYLSFLLIAHDRYEDVFKTLEDTPGYPGCDALLQQSLSEVKRKKVKGEGKKKEEEEEEGGEGRRRWYNVHVNVSDWGARLRRRRSKVFGKFGNGDGTTSIPGTTEVRVSSTSLQDTLTSSIYHIWSHFTLLYNIRNDNILLSQSVHSFIPPRASLDVILRPRPSSWSWSIFRCPLFRQATGSSQIRLSSLSKEDNDTIAWLDQEIRKRRIRIEPPEEWVWESLM